MPPIELHLVRPDAAPRRPVETLHLSLHVNAARSAVLHALTDGALFGKALGRPVTMKAEAGGRIASLDGFLEGSWEALSDRRLSLRIRLALPGWPPTEWSPVEIDLADERGGTRFVLEQTLVPMACSPATLVMWRDQVLGGIKRLLENKVRPTSWRLHDDLRV